MSSLMPFQFHGHDVPAIQDDDGNPWWKASDVCKHCGVTNVSQACSRLDADEKADITIDDVTGRPQATLIVNEAGLYRLALSSRKPEAKEFKRWVIHDVLPQIRKTGRYEPTLPKLHNPMSQVMIDTVMRVDALEYAVTQERNERLRLEAGMQRAEAGMQRAETKADLALANAHHMTISDFILGNGLVRQFPEHRYSSIAKWLGDFCQQWGLPTYADPVVAKPWPAEKSYPLQAFAAWLRMEQRKPQQVALVPRGAPR